MGLQQFERRLERLVEGAFARAFRGGLQPVEVARRITREMDLLRKVGVRGMIAPNAFEVSLAPEDLERFASFEAALEKELAEAARDHARSEGYSFLGPVSVSLSADPSVPPGTVGVSAQVKEAPGGGQPRLVLPAGSHVELADTVVVGRLPDCGVVLADPNVSRRHAELRRQGPDVVLVDLGSTNGSRVNGVRVSQRRLEDGDEITLGTTTLRFEAP
jgi:hypothetical protein